MLHVFMMDCGFIICNDVTVSHLKQYSTMIMNFLSELSPVIESYVLDFFVENHWQKIPVSWQNVLSKLELQDISCFLNVKENIRFKEVWPLSLLAFRKCAFVLSLPRKAVESPSVIKSFLEDVNHYKRIKNSSAFMWKAPAEEFKNSSGHHRNIYEACRRHVKPKKQHEISRFAQLTDFVMQNIGLDRVVDIGSGQGHLSRLLCLQYHLKVISIEAEHDHIAGAARFDKQAFSSLQKSRKKNQNSNYNTNDKINWNTPKHFKSYLTAESAKECLENITKGVGLLEQEGSEMAPFAVLGLHTCGNLAATLLRIFTEIPEAHALLSVGCCYMKLSTNEANSGYPLSTYISKFPSHKLSYEAREVACHALEGYIERLKENATSLKIHCYRAVLEKLITKYYPNMKHTGLKSVKYSESLSYREYVIKALKNTDVEIPDKDITSPETTEDLQQWRKVVIIYSLRLLIAPVIESLILLDRMLFLYEKGCYSCILPVFDPSLSPRNYVLLSVKKIIS